MAAGEKDLLLLTKEIAEKITANGGRVDYVEAVDADELESISVKGDRPVMIALAAYFGSTRLIDNMVF